MLQYQGRLPDCWMKTIATSCWPSKGCSWWLTVIHSGILRDAQSRSGWCLKRVRSQKYHPFALMRHHVCCGTTRTRCHFSMQSFLKHLSLGEFSSASQVFCVAHYWNCLFAFTKKQMAVGPCQKSGEQQRCDNPRVKGVNMRRKFHAWQVCRMAPVFSLFTHANEQYADEQTWAQPRLHAAKKNWQEVCRCGSATSSRFPFCVL